MDSDRMLQIAIHAAFWGGLVLIFLLVTRRKRKQILAPLADLLGVQPDSIKLNVAKRLNRLEGHFAGRPASLSLLEDDEETRKGAFQIAVSCRIPATFKIRRKLLRDKLSKAVGKVSIIETGNAQFDRQFTFSCDQPEPLSRWAGKPEVSQQIFLLMSQSGVTRLEGKRGVVMATFSPYNRDLTERTRVGQVLQETNALAQSIEQVELSPA